MKKKELEQGLTKRVGMLNEQVRMHKITRDTSYIWPPHRSDNPLSASNSILCILGRPKKNRVTDEWTNKPIDGSMSRESQEKLGATFDQITFSNLVVMQEY